MSNMSYCRFQNTVKDLQDCKDAFDEANLNGSTEDQLSHDEAQAFLRLKELMEEFLDDIDNMSETPGEEIHDMETLKIAHPYLFRGDDDEEE